MSGFSDSTQHGARVQAGLTGGPFAAVTCVCLMPRLEAFWQADAPESDRTFGVGLARGALKVPEFSEATSAISGTKFSRPLMAGARRGRQRLRAGMRAGITDKEMK